MEDCGPAIHEERMEVALRLARRAYGMTSPNPMVGALLVKNGNIIGRGWHRRAGLPHAEVEALSDARRRGIPTAGADLYVTLEPCCTHGKTPPCTEAIIQAGIRTVFVGATDPNPKHRGRGLRILRRAGLEVLSGILYNECLSLNESFNHWIVCRQPFVTVKAAMTLDGKIATASGESKWITGEKARAFGMKLRQGSDAILVGVNTIVADDPGLTFRGRLRKSTPGLQRFVLDSEARTPLSAKVVSDEFAPLTTIVVSENAAPSRVKSLSNSVRVLTCPASKSGKKGHSGIDISWLLRQMGNEQILSLLVEGGGEVNASFLLGGYAHRVAFFYGPKVLGGFTSRRAVAGTGVKSLQTAVKLRDVNWRRLGADLLLSARVMGPDLKSS